MYISQLGQDRLHGKVAELWSQRLHFIQLHDGVLSIVHVTNHQEVSLLPYLSDPPSPVPASI